ncbi:MAG: phosphodiester glycosidase family protein [Candidatus Izimaplasma sp.]|nr:phosphodiester glycosidase family protein [Candidatus Izimaplasma bacterium]
MNKIKVIIVLLFFITNIAVTEVTALFRVNEETKETIFVEGVRHTEIYGSINYDGDETPQKINYLGANPTTFSNLNIVTGDNYLNHGWGKGDLLTLIDNINGQYPNYNVIGGVNGDFFGASGIPIEAYVRDFEVISSGLGIHRTVLGFKDTGEVVYGTPCFDGYELLVKNDLGQKKQSLSINSINQTPIISSALTIYFDSYTEAIDNAYDKVVIGLDESHFDDNGATHFGKGNFVSSTTDTLDEVAPLTMIIVGENFNDDELITETDEVIVQKKLACGYEDVRFAIGGWSVLIENNNVISEYTSGAGLHYRHPRTAVGIKEDGTVFFVTVDGRDVDGRWKGMTHPELAELMAHFGAVNAFNLDGGGSTTMAVLNDDLEYHIVNTPSDGNPRPVTNGLFFVKGEHIPVPEDALFPDTRELLPLPTNIFIQDGLLSFDAIDHATGYEISINGNTSELDTNTYQLDLTPGTHEIMIRALGDKTSYKTSDYTELILYTVYTENMSDIIDFLKQYSKHETTN